MSVAITVTKGIAWVTIASVIGKIVILGNLFLILTHLSVYEYGLSELVFSTISIASIVLLPGLSSAIVADLGVERARGKRASMKSLFVQFFTLISGLSVLAWAGLFFGAPAIAGLAGNPDIGTYLQIASFLFLISPLRLASTMLATVELRYADQSLFSVVEEIAKGAILIVLFFGLGRTLDALFYAAVLSQVIAVVLFLPRTVSAYRMMGKEREHHDVFWKAIRSHHGWSIAASYGSNLVQALQLWIIRFFFGTETVGLYAFASGIVSQVASLLPLNTVLTSLAPAYADRRNELGRLIKASLKMQFIFAIGLIGITILTLPVFLLLFPKYEPATPLVLALVGSVLISGAATVFTPVFVALKQQRSLLISVLVKFLATIVVMPASIMLFGLPGIGVAIILILLLSVIERYARIRRLLPDFSLSPRDFSSISPEERQYAKLLLERTRIRALLRKLRP